MNLAGAGWSGPLNVTVFALVLLGNSVIVYSNLTAAKSVRAAFVRKNDPELLRVDVPGLLTAAESGFPGWTWTLPLPSRVAVSRPCRS